MAHQSIPKRAHQPNPPPPLPWEFVGPFSFCFGKAANVPQWSWVFIQKPHGGA